MRNPAAKATRNLRWILGIVALALLTAACGTADPGPSNGEAATGGTSEAPAVPEMVIAAYQGEAALGGEEVRLSELLDQGKPVVLDFWAALCPPCRAEMPDFQRVYDARADEVVILGIDVGPQLNLGSREQGRDLLRELDISYPAGTSFDDNVARTFSIRGMPTTLFIHPDHGIQRSWTGLMDEATMHRLIDELLAA